MSPLSREDLAQLSERISQFIEVVSEMVYFLSISLLMWQFSFLFFFLQMILLVCECVSLRRCSPM